MLASQYRRGEVYVPAGACETIEPTISEDWRYRYNAGGEREQKREYSGTQGNDNNAGGALGWTYYSLGADKRPLAIYHGIETRNACSNSDTMVYLYPSEYISYGIGLTSNIITKPDGSKEYKLQDHLGSTRATLSGTGTIVSTADYAPFGSIVSQTGTQPTKGFIDKEKDKESNLHNLGVRQYDEERFNSIDPMWEKFPDLTPYNYAENNPVVLKDPNGDCPWCLAALGAAVWYMFSTPQIAVAPTMDKEKDQRQIANAKDDIDKIQMAGGLGGIVKGVEKQAVKTAVKEGLKEGGQQVTKKLFSSVDDVIKSAGKLERLKGGAQQGFIKGDAEKIFAKLTKGAEKLESGASKLKDGTILNLHKSTKDGVTSTLDINKGGQIFKIRVE